MYGVGVCAVSRCVNIAQTLLDVLVFKQEKLGSRPHRAIIITQGGLDPTDIQAAFDLASEGMDSAGLSRYSKTVVAGSSSLSEAAVQIVELSSLPDGFDEQTSTEISMAVIALAFGVDVRELFPSSQSGATRAEALIQHLKQRGKGPGQIIQSTEMLFDQKFLPPHLRMIYDVQDDAEDRQVADIRKVRADRRLQDMNTGVMNERTMREQMMESGDLTRSQFERMELTDGRLHDGSSVLLLFYSKDTTLKTWLDVGVDDPLDFESNDQVAMLSAILEKITEVLTVMADERNEVRKWNELMALSALIFLKRFYKDPTKGFEDTMGYKIEDPLLETGSTDRIDNRVRGNNPANPKMNEEVNTERNERTQTAQDLGTKKNA
jgi:hypothetical protein